MVEEADGETAADHDERGAAEASKDAGDHGGEHEQQHVVRELVGVAVDRDRVDDLPVPKGDGRVARLARTVC